MKKKMTALTLALLMAMSLGACGDGETPAGQSGSEAPAEETAAETANETAQAPAPGSPVLEAAKAAAADTRFPYDEIMLDDQFTGDFVEADASLDVNSVLQNMTYTPDMFWGAYTQNTQYTHGINSPTDDFVDTCGWMDGQSSVGLEYPGGESYEVSAVPFGFEAGWGKLMYAPLPMNSDDEKGMFLASTPQYNWCVLYYTYRTEQENGTINMLASYRIEGNKIIFDFADDVGYDMEAKRPRIHFTGTSVSYEFGRFGPALALSDGEHTVGLQNLQFCGDYLVVFTASDGDTPEDYYENIASINFSYSKNPDEDAAESRIAFYMGQPVIGDILHGAYRINSDGTMTMNVQSGDGSVASRSLVYFYADDWNGIVFADKDRTYHYWNSYLRDKYLAMISENFTEEDKKKVAAMSESAVGEIMMKRSSMLDDIMDELKAAGIAASVDTVSGEIALDSEVLFGYDQSDLSAEGEETLAKLMKALSKVLGKETYNDFISELVVQGHTDTAGDHDYNQKLSEKRAETAMNYSLDSVKDEAEIQGMFKSLMRSEGCSFDRPIYDNEGNVDMEASRRVVFLFHIRVD